MITEGYFDTPNPETQITVFGQQSSGNSWAIRDGGVEVGPEPFEEGSEGLLVRVALCPVPDGVVRDHPAPPRATLFFGRGVFPAATGEKAG